MYEVFNRLNTGGVSLRPQEIRTSMYHSGFYDMLSRINVNSTWRCLLQSQEPDLDLKDIKVLLRGFGMLIDGSDYRPSMIKFLNRFSKKCASNDSQDNEYLESLRQYHTWFDWKARTAFSSYLATVSRNVLKSRLTATTD